MKRAKKIVLISCTVFMNAVSAADMSKPSLFTPEQITPSQELIQAAKKALSKKALIDAVKEGDAQKVTALLTKNTSLDIFDDIGCTPLIWAAYRGHAEIVDILIAAGASVNTQDTWGGITALISAIMSHHPVIVQKLLDANASVDTQTKEGTSALSWAARHNCGDIVDILIGAGSTLDSTCERKQTALMNAATRGHATIVKKLIEARASINAQDQQGYSALMHAGFEGHIETVKELLAYRADIGLTTTQGHTVHYIVQVLNESRQATPFLSNNFIGVIDALNTHAAAQDDEEDVVVTPTI